MKTPKQRFLDVKQAADKHRDTVDSSQFSLALDLALLEVLWNLPESDDVQKAAANHWKLRGALTYMKTLESLGNVAKDRASLPDDNLTQPR